MQFLLVQWDEYEYECVKEMKRHRPQILATAKVKRERVAWPGRSGMVWVEFDDQKPLSEALW